MSLTATGPLFFCLALYVFFFKPEKLAFYCVFFAPFSATAIVNFTALGYKSGGVGLTPAMAFIMLFFTAQLLYFYVGRPVRVSVGHLIQLGLIVLFVAYILVTLLANGADHAISSYQMTQTIYLLIGLFATMLLSLDFAREGGIELAVRAARASAVFVSVWGLVQLFCSVLHVPYPSFLFNNSASDAADMFAQELTGSIARIASVAVEPSVLATSLLHFAAFGATAIAYDSRLRTREWLLPVGLSLGVLILSSSSTAYVGLATLGLLILLERPVVALVVGAPAGLTIAAMIAVVASIRDALLEAVLTKTETSSYLERTTGAARDFAQFWLKPMIGSGWGSAANFNAVSALLASTGLIGTTLVVATGLYTIVSLLLGTAGAGSQNWRLAAYGAGVRNALIVAAACAITSGIKYVFLDDWVFWALAIAIASRLGIAGAATAAAYRRTASRQWGRKTPLSV